MEGPGGDLPIVPNLPDSPALLEYLRKEQRSGKKLIGLAIGTRPEAIKMAPIVQCLTESFDRYIALPIATGQ